MSRVIRATAYRIKTTKTAVGQIVQRVRDPAIVICDCGERVVCDDSWVNPCDCGETYDGSGNQLAPLHQWGEETGEHWADTLRPGFDDDF